MSPLSHLLQEDRLGWCGVFNIIKINFWGWNWPLPEKASTFAQVLIPVYQLSHARLTRAHEDQRERAYAGLAAGPREGGRSNHITPFN